MTVTATFGLRDWSGNWDDQYTGLIDIVVLAELIDPSTLPPRGDLIITGMEINQATQHFRSALHLDAANVRPDNSIPLVARKATAVRVYVDYDVNSGLPAINQLDGELEVTTAFGSTTIDLAPQATIAPLRDAQIQRRNVGHTLNFVIPEEWCQGELGLRARVFESGTTGAGSPNFQRSIVFREVEALRISTVQITYTGQTPNLAAPTQNAILTSLGFTEATYPVPEAFVTAFQTLTFSGNLAAAGSGCGSAFSALLDDLEDFGGDVDEIVCGFLPGGVNFGPAVGCARRGQGVCAAPIDRQNTVAHELAHSVGRKHSPGGCGNADNDFPQYGSFGRDSIGEFGYDTRNDTINDPATTFDFMCGRPRWVSPYTYIALADVFRPVESTAFSFLTAFSLKRGLTQGVAQAVQIEKSERLFLCMGIDRKRNIQPRHSFHYPAQKRSLRREEPTQFTVEILDDDGVALVCEAISERCVACNEGCWPIAVREVIPFPEGGRTLVVYENAKKIYRERIPDPPEVSAKAKLDGESIRVAWTLRSDESEKDVWYLVQWRDRWGDWRGAAPRTQEHELLIPRRAFGRQKVAHVRVLASSGIATGMAEVSVPLWKNHQPEKPEEVTIVPVARIPGRLLVVRAIAEDGSTVHDPELCWYDEEGAEIERGSGLRLGALPAGHTLVRAVLRDTGQGGGEQVFRLDEDGEGESDPEPDE